MYEVYIYMSSDLGYKKQITTGSHYNTISDINPMTIKLSQEPNVLADITFECPALTNHHDNASVPLSSTAGKDSGVAYTIMPDGIASKSAINAAVTFPVDVLVTWKSLYVSSSYLRYSNRPNSFTSGYVA